MELEFYLQRTICINLGRTTCEFAPRLFLARVKLNIKQLSLSIFLYQPIPMEINCTLRIRKICTSPVDYAQVPIRINISSFHMTYIIIINIEEEKRRRRKRRKKEEEEERMKEEEGKKKYIYIIIYNELATNS